jgi:calnexin
VPDPAATAPADWNEEEDGEWEAPMVPNPKCKAAGCGTWVRPQIVNPAYKGKWYPPRIENPAYKGEWKPRQIPNKNYFEDAHPNNVHPMSAVGFELLSVSGGIVFDNLLLTDSEDLARKFAEVRPAPSRAIARAAAVSRAQRLPRVPQPSTPLLRLAPAPAPGRAAPRWSGGTRAPAPCA